MSKSSQIKLGVGISSCLARPDASFLCFLEDLKFFLTGCLDVVNVAWEVWSLAFACLSSVGGEAVADAEPLPEASMTAFISRSSADMASFLDKI